MWVCVWQLPHAGVHQEGTSTSLQLGCPGISLCSWEVERVTSLSGAEHLDSSELFTFLPHLACYAHASLELRSLFQNREENLSAGREPMTHLGGHSFRTSSCYMNLDVFTLWNEIYSLIVIILYVFVTVSSLPTRSLTFKAQ